MKHYLRSFIRGFIGKPGAIPGRFLEHFKNQYVTSADLALPPNGSSESVKILTSVCIYLRPDRSTGLLDIPKWGSEARLGSGAAENSISF